MTETTQLIVAAAYGAAFGGGAVVLVGWLAERRQRRERPRPPVRFTAPARRQAAELIFDAPRLSPLWAGLGRTAAAFAALGAALFRALAPIVGKMSG